MREDEIRDDYLQEIEVIRERKTQYLDRKFTLEILKRKKLGRRDQGRRTKE